MQLLLQTLVNSLVIGGVYGIFSMGLALEFGTLNIVNFAHGDIVMLAMYAGLFLLGWHVAPVAMFLIALIAFFVLGVLLYFGLFNDLTSRKHETQLLTTLTVSMILENLAQSAFTASARSANLPMVMMNLGGIQLSFWKTVGLGLSLVVALGLWLLLQKTSLGRDIRATVDDAPAARLQGIDTRRIYMISFGIGTLLAGAAGAVLITFYAVQPFIGNNLMVLAFAAVVVGGTGSIPGAFLGGFIISIIQQFSATYLAPDLQNVYVFLLFIGILVFKPTGLVGRTVRFD